MQDIDQIGILHDRKLNRFAGLIVQAIDKALRAPRQVDLAQAGRAEVEDPGAQNVTAAIDAARDVTPVVQVSK